MANNVNFHSDDSREETIRKIQTAESIAIPRDVFEKLYLSPQQPAAGNLRKTFGNPTPVALVGFLLASTPNACALMGWRGAGGGGGAILPVFIFFGGLLQLFGGIGEWILGNTFSSVLFFTYGAFWLAKVPPSNLFSPSAPTVPQPATAQKAQQRPDSTQLQVRIPLQTPVTSYCVADHPSRIGFYLLFLAMLTFIFLICSLRTNVVLFSGLLFLVIAFSTLCGTYFHLALGNVALAGRQQIVGGGFTFALCVCIWYLLFVQMLEAVNFPLTLPVGDLSAIVPEKSPRAPARQSVD